MLCWCQWRSTLSMRQIFISLRLKTYEKTNAEEKKDVEEKAQKNNKTLKRKTNEKFSFVDTFNNSLSVCCHPRIHEVFAYFIFFLYKRSWGKVDLGWSIRSYYSVKAFLFNFSIQKLIWLTMSKKKKIERIFKKTNEIEDKKAKSLGGSRLQVKRFYVENIIFVQN